MRVDAVSFRETVETASVLGRFVAREAGPVAAAVAGPVERFEVEVGSRVALGDPIAVIDAGEHSARRDLAAAELAQADAALVTAKAELLLAQQELQRAEGLRGSSAYSPARSEDAKARVAIAEARIAEADALIVARKSSLGLAELELSRAHVKAPYAGVVVRTLTEVGAYVRVGDPLVDLIDDGNLEIEADVPFQFLSGLTAGTEITVTLDDGRRLGATVRAVVPDEDPLTRTRMVRFAPSLSGAAAGLASGQTARLQLPTGARRSALTVHKDAVLPDPQGATVFLAIERDGKLVAEPRRVVLGAAIGDRFEVLQGLVEGDRAVVRGNERLKAGQSLALTG